MALYFTESDVAQVLDMPLALQAVREVHRAHGKGAAMDVPRERVRTPSAIQHVLQAAWPERGVMGFKAYISSRSGARFAVHLFGVTGEPLAVIEADLLGMTRTGAAGGVAASCLGRADASVAGVIGAGWQAQGQILALCEVLPVQLFRVHARDAEKLNRFCAAMSTATGRRVEPAASAAAAVEGADVIVTATTSSTPVLDGDWLKPGCHVNAVGSNSLVRRELDEKLVSRADIICVDSRETARRECGDLLAALEKGRLHLGALPELGEVLNGARRGRTGSSQITVFESQGMGIQDIAVAIEVLERGRAAGLGQPLPY